MRSVFKSPMTERVSPKHRLLADRAARVVAVLADTVTTTGGPPDGPRLAAAHDEIHATLGTEPPVEWPGCDSCPARCGALGRLTALPAATWTTAEARVSMAAPAANRADLLLQLLDQVPTPAPGAPRDLGRALGHCLATVAAGRRSLGPHGAVPDVDDVVAAVGADARGGP